VILVTGASGTVGVRLVRRLTAAGHAVRALVLPGDPLRPRLDGTGCELCEGDLRDGSGLAAALAGSETVYHLAAVVLSEDARLFRQVNVEGTRRLLEAAVAARAGHFIYISSASVVYPSSAPYARSKREAERLVLARADRLGVTVVRPTLVYETGGGIELQIFERLLRLPLVPLIDGGRVRKNPVHVEDLVDGLAAIAGRRETFGKIYNLCGGEEVTLRELAELLLERRGERRRFISVPLPLCRLAAGVIGPLSRRRELARHALAGLSQDASLDPTAAGRDLGYHPVGVREGLARCADLQPGSSR